MTKFSAVFELTPVVTVFYWTVFTWCQIKPTINLESASFRAIRNGLVYISVAMSVLYCVSTTDPTKGSIAAMKASLRKEINLKLSCLASSYVEERSTVLRDALMQVKQYSDSQILSVYLSMPQSEVATYDIIQEAFMQQKRVFVPKILGKKSHDMFMFEVSSFAVLNSFDRNRWGIPEPGLEAVSNSPDGTYQGLIDLVLVPGVAFDPMCARLGHGKGYYGILDAMQRSQSHFSLPMIPFNRFFHRPSQQT